MRLFLDANVMFTAAHNPEGKAALVLELGRAGLWELATSAYALEEARRNLARKYPDRLARFETDSQGLRLAPDSPQTACPAALPDKDRPIYRAASLSKADVLLTGDLRHFSPLMNDRDKAGGLLIQTVADFLAAL